MKNHSLTAYLKDEADLELVGDVASSLGVVVTKVKGAKSEICADSRKWVIPPQIILIDLSDEEDMAAALEEIGEHGPETSINVVVVGSENDARKSRKLRQLGIVDYLVKPLNRDELVEACTQAMQKDEGRDVSVEPQRVLTVTGTQGGTGASTLAAACASEYARRGLKTLLLDLDFLSGIQYHLHGGDVSEGFRDTIQEPSRFDETSLARTISRVGSTGDLYMLSEPGEMAITPDAADFHAFLALLTSAFEMVVIDLPRHTEWARSVLPLSSRIFCMAQPTLAGVDYALAFSRTESKSLISDSLIFVLNDVNGAKGEGLKLDDFSKRISHPFLSMPHDPVTIYRLARNDEVSLSAGKMKKSMARIFETLPDVPRKVKEPSQDSKKGKSLARSFLDWLNE